MTTDGTYKPHGKSKEILDRAMGYIQAVPYRVTLRWLFYRLLQDGTYSSKQDYEQLKSLTSRARKAFYDGWSPNTLADDGREAFIKGFGHYDSGDWLRAILRHGCNLDKWGSQPNYVELWFEAAAMRSQFEYYTRHVTLRPFKGDPSLDFKWEICQHLEAVHDTYPDKSIVILYFGDLDPKGLQIPESAVSDVRSWAGVDFEYIRCGLNPGDEVRYNLHENPEKPGTYQWEALDDEQASRLLVSSVAQYIDFDAMAAIESQEDKITARFSAMVPELARQLMADDLEVQP